MSELAAILEAELGEFDGKALTTLTEIRARHGDVAEFISALVSLCGKQNANIASGASWLLKDHLETGESLTGEQLAAYIAIMPDLIGWQAQLHACQSLQFLKIAEEAAIRLAAWLGELTSHDRPFLRAWSLDGLVRLALQHDAYKAAAMAALQRASVDEAASVKARARKLEKLFARS